MPAKSIAQQQAAGMAYAAKKGKMPISKLKGASKEMYKMSKSELKKYAGTKHASLPAKKEDIERQINIVEKYINKLKEKLNEINTKDKDISKIKNITECILGDLPSSKLIKMKWNPVKEPKNENIDRKTLNDIIDTIDEFYSKDMYKFKQNIKNFSGILFDEKFKKSDIIGYLQYIVDVTV